MEVHIVVKGDTLWKIARQYNIPFEELKRVNAHLANPDYIVPGMKIFLPMDKKKPIHKGEQSKPQPDQEPHHKPTEKPVKSPHAQPSEKPRPPVVAPLPQIPPLPEVPQMPMQPQPQPQPQQPMPPMQEQPPPMPPMQSPQMPAVPMWHAVFPVCGWMPIFDADCHPHMPHQPMPQPIQAPIQPMPPKESSTWYRESSHHHMPPPAPMPDGWQLIESSSLHVSKAPMPKPPVMQPMPPVIPTPPVTPTQPTIPPKACTPATWCPSNQAVQEPCSQQWPIQQPPQWPVDSMPPMHIAVQPFQWLPVCPPVPPMMPQWPQPMNPNMQPWPQNMPPCPTQQPDDWHGNH